MKPHADSDRLTRTIKRLTGDARSWSGEVFRSSSPRYANRDDLATGFGSKLVGGRWNPPSSFATVYTSLNAHTALEEAFAHFRHFNIPPAKTLPRVLVAMEASLKKVLDLTDGAVRRLLRISTKRLIEEPWREFVNRDEEAITQAIGRVAWQEEIEGLLVPSAAWDKNTNLIIFPANLEPPGSWLKILNRDQLPPLT